MLVIHPRVPTLTIWQPWASLILAGAKPFEWRKWHCPNKFIGRRIAIHAGARKVRKGELTDLIHAIELGHHSSLIVDVALPLLRAWRRDPEVLPLSSMLCTARLGQPVLASEHAQAHGMDSDRVDHTVWGWPLTEIIPIEPMEPAKGAQGFWYWRRP